MDRAGLDDAEIGYQRTAHRNVLDAPDQIGKRRMQLLDNRRVLVAVLGDQDVDLVTVEYVAGSEFSSVAVVIFTLDDKHGDIFDEIGANRFDVLNDPGKVIEGSLSVLNQLVDRIFRGVTIELAHLIAPLLLPLRQLMDDMFEVLF